MTKLFSIIITAHNRDRYVKYAINSVLSQTLKDYEIILVTNLNIPGLSNIIKIIYDNNEYLGEKVYKGFSESEGNIICFLDDDDMFRVDKLERVNSLFRFFKGTIYYHNNFATIDDKGHEIRVKEDYLKVPPYASLYTLNYPIILEHTHTTNIKYLKRLNANFNSSSICVSKEVINENVKYLRRIKAIIDSFLFYSSLKMEGKILLDPERLTYYRIHDFQTSSGSTQGVNEYKKSLSNLFSKALEDSYVIKEMLGNNDIVDEDITTYFLLYNIFSGRKINGNLKLSKSTLKYFILSIMPYFIREIYIKGQFNRRLRY
ncbi:glycosyltransferase family A protein [Acidianus ambivalens]|uniref:Glycosyltransferase n=1 Tax=Acidianus ambivalens TaxID=2283 RepID=A0A650CVR0_ACIAM|nr:glycosyltransferase family 2 protein [Acidianus ambivalens]MQL56514.1 glycosyltransferase [Acidianus ambivalens]QGR21961.1 glycosyltransferase [Acidianus ambivalens]